MKGKKRLPVLKLETDSAFSCLFIFKQETIRVTNAEVLTKSFQEGQFQLNTRSPESYTSFLAREAGKFVKLPWLYLGRERHLTNRQNKDISPKAR